MALHLPEHHGGRSRIERPRPPTRVTEALDLTTIGRKRPLSPQNANRPPVLIRIASTWQVHRERRWSPRSLVFAFMRVLPGDPAAGRARASTRRPRRLRRPRQEFGTDRPQAGAVRGTGSAGCRSATSASPTSREESIGPHDRRTSVQVTLILVLAAMLVALLIAIPLGHPGGGAPPPSPAAR